MNRRELASVFKTSSGRLIVAMVFMAMALVVLCASGVFAQKAHAADASAGKLSSGTTEISAAKASKATTKASKSKKKASKGTTTMYLLTKKTDPKYSRRNESFKYNKYGLLTTYNHYYCGTISIQYDELMRMTSYSAPGWFKGTVTYDSQGRVAEVKSVNYDGRLMNTAEYSPAITQFTYNKKNQVASTLSYSYDENVDGGIWTSKLDDGRENITYYSYDKKGRVKKSVSPYGTTTIKYDSKGHVKPTAFNKGTKIKYNKQGLKAKVTYPADPKGFQYSYKYKYKKVKVPKKYAKLVEQQQRSLQGYKTNDFPLLY